jgi:hypothetical protein
LCFGRIEWLKKGNFIFLVKIKVLAIALILTVPAIQPASFKDTQSPQIVTQIDSLLRPIPRAPLPDFDVEILQPLVTSNQQIKSACDTQGGDLNGLDCVLPPPAPVYIPLPVSTAKAFIYNHESGNNTWAINTSSGACGLGQALPCSKMPCSLGDYTCQDQFFTAYMQQRYGTWEVARNFWLSRGWW